MGIIWFVRRLYKQSNENNFVPILNKNTKDENSSFIKLLDQDDKLVMVENYRNYFEFSCGYILRMESHKLVLVADDNRILFNLRNTGGGNSRPAATIGEGFFKRRIIKKIRYLTVNS